MEHGEPPLAYLLESSEERLRDFCVSRLGKAADLRKEIRKLVTECIEQKAEALLASWLLEHGAAIAALGATSAPVEKVEQPKGSEEAKSESASPEKRRLKPLSYEHWRSAARHARRAR